MCGAILAGAAVEVLACLAALGAALVVRRETARFDRAAARDAGRHAVEAAAAAPIDDDGILCCPVACYATRSLST